MKPLFELSWNRRRLIEWLNYSADREPAATIGLMMLAALAPTPSANGARRESRPTSDGRAFPLPLFQLPLPQHRKDHRRDDEDVQEAA